jgi:hypothetical protein
MTPAPPADHLLSFTFARMQRHKRQPITALYDTGAPLSLITPADFEAIKRSGVVIGPIPEMTCRVQNASQQPMQTEGAWRVRLYLKGRPLSAAMIVTSDVAQSIVGMNIIGPIRLVKDPVTCTVDFSDEGTAAALGVLGQREVGTIADMRVLKATTIPGASRATTQTGVVQGRAPSQHTNDELEVILKLITDNVNRTVPYQYRSENIAMLMARQHFFSADSLDLGFTDLEQHTMDLKDKDPVFSPQFRLKVDSGECGGMAAGRDYSTVKVTVQLANILCAEEGRPGAKMCARL